MKYMVVRNTNDTAVVSSIMHYYELIVHLVPMVSIQLFVVVWWCATCIHSQRQSPHQRSLSATPWNRL